MDKLFIIYMKNAPNHVFLMVILKFTIINIIKKKSLFIKISI